jgi:hypothetical protein
VDGLWKICVFCDEMPSSTPPAIGCGAWGWQGKANGPASLQRVRHCVFRRLLQRDERMDYTLDIDATQIVAEKREAHTCPCELVRADLRAHASLVPEDAPLSHF